jgi:hypothetical protein
MRGPSDDACHDGHVSSAYTLRELDMLRPNLTNNEIETH